MNSSTFFQLLFGALLGLGALAGAILISLAISLDPHPDLAPLLIAGALALAFLAVLAYAIWRDPLPVLKALIVVGLFGTALSLLPLAQERSLSQIPSFWVSLAVLVAATAGYVWIPRTAAGARHVLLGRPGRVYEFEGLQFTLAPGRLAHPGGTLPIDLWIENCWTGQRVLEVRGRWPRGKAPGVAITLGPEACESKRVELPVPEKARGRIELPLDLVVSGIRGRRVKPRRATIVRNKVRGVDQLAGLLLGVFQWGGGLRLPVEIVEHRSAAG